MPNQDTFAPITAVLGDFQMHLGHQRTGGIEDLQSALLRFEPHSLGNAVGTEDDDYVVRHLIELFDKDRPTRTQVFHHELVVHHFMPYIDRRAEDFQSTVDDFDGAIDTSAEAAGIGEFDLHD